MKVSLLEGAPGRLRPEIDGATRPDVQGPSRRAAARRRRKTSMRWVNLAILVAPTVVAAIYFGLVASPRYESETQFIVRGIQGNGRASRPREPDARVRHRAVERRQQRRSRLSELARRRHRARGRPAAARDVGPSPADPLSRFPRPLFGDSFERLYWYYAGSRRGGRRPGHRHHHREGAGFPSRRTRRRSRGSCWRSRRRWSTR